MSHLIQIYTVYPLVFEFLKVGSCPNDASFVQIFFLFFSV